jgi:hypothetical protein
MDVMAVKTVKTWKAVETAVVGAPLNHLDPRMRTGGSTNHLSISARINLTRITLIRIQSYLAGVMPSLTSETFGDRIHPVRTTPLALYPREEMPVFDVPALPLPVSPLPRVQYLAER